MSLVLDRPKVIWHPPTLPLSRQIAIPRQRLAHQLDWIDLALVCLFLAGLYTTLTIQIAARVPFPSAPSGVAGLCLLWRRREQVTARAVTCLMGILCLYVLSMLFATNIGFLSRRTNGLIQLTYSLTIGYALFLTILQANRRQVAALFLTLSLVILVGCLLESYTGFRSVSDSVRRVLYSRGIYENDLRDLLYYKRVRPKLFASEPASVTFCYTLFTFLWFVTSPWRRKFVLYLALAGAGLFAMPGPTLLLLLLLVLPYMLFLASRHNGRLSVVRMVKVMCVAAFCLVGFVALGSSLFSARLEQANAGNDPSFFYRVQGPLLAAQYVLANYPLAGAGLTGEPFIEREVVNVYVRSPSFSTGWRIVTPATELMINFFWLHWIYLGLLWGLVVIAGLTLWLHVLGVPSPAFCWLVWAILGQSSGAYVGPTCWAVLFLAAAAAVLQQRPREIDEALQPPPQPVPPIRAVWLDTLIERPRVRPLALSPEGRKRAPVPQLGIFPPEHRNVGQPLT